MARNPTSVEETPTADASEADTFDPMARETELVSKITPKHLGNPRAPENDNERFYLGRLIGIATGTELKKQPNGDVFTAILGNFLGLPARVDRNNVRSGVLYLPGGIHEMVVNSLGDGNIVRFGFDLYTVKANNPVGYSWAVQPLTTTQSVDPLDEVLAEIGAKDKPMKMLPPPRRGG